MTHDAWQQLRDANPVTIPVSWPEDRIRETAAGIVAGDNAPGPRDDRSARRWLLPVAAAASIAAVTAGISVGIAAVAHDDRVTSGSGSVTCQVSTDGGRARTTVRLTKARSVVATRAGALGSTGQSFDVDATTGTLVVRARGIDVGAASTACRATTTSVRPLVFAAVPVNAAAPTTGEPVKNLGFPVPRDAQAAAALTAAQRGRLATVLSHTACRALLDEPEREGPVVRCATVGGQSLAYLLGSALAADDDVTDAEAVAPSVDSGGTAQWTVSVSFDHAAGRRVAAFTTAHSTTRPGDGPTTCEVDSQPSCADYLAFEVNGRVLQSPLTTEPIAGTSLVLSGDFTAASARALAADYEAASIGLSLP